ncbi:MAG TPA: transporter [Rhodothermales bacterium]|nr:transporter [Rhodothermales bacterium]
MTRLFPFALLLALAGPATAQGTIATDRPGFAFSPVVVPARSFQVEIGTPLFTRSSFDAAGTEVTSTLINVPTALRYGLTSRLELRASSTLFNSATVEAGGLDETETGFGDVEVGLKVQLLTADGGTPALSVIPSVVLPLGSDGFSAGDPVVNLNAVAGITLPAGLGLTLVGGATVPTADSSSVTANLVALVGRAFTPALSGYVEASAFPTDGATPLYVGAGLAFLVTPTVQLDTALDVGLNEEAQDVIGGVGVSFRFGGR